MSARQRSKRRKQSRMARQYKRAARIRYRLCSKAALIIDFLSATVQAMTDDPHAEFEAFRDVRNPFKWNCIARSTVYGGPVYNSGPLECFLSWLPGFARYRWLKQTVGIK